MPQHAANTRLETLQRRLDYFFASRDNDGIRSASDYSAFDAVLANDIEQEFVAIADANPGIDGIEAVIDRAEQIRRSETVAGIVKRALVQFLQYHPAIQGRLGVRKREIFAAQVDLGNATLDSDTIPDVLR